jgi:23S rRNA (cytosine1962-C5)-methyltransferase
MNKIVVRRRHFDHPWVFSNEVIKKTDAAPGEAVCVEESRKLIGCGFYNPHSLIAVRFFSRSEEPFNAEFVHKKLTRALELRKDMGQSFRLVYSESDGLPGLIVDKYGDHLAVQINCLGMDMHKDLIFSALIEELKPRSIYEKSDEGLRKLEGLGPVNKVAHGEVPQLVEIEQDGLKFLVDMINGQKTGFFFDQRENRKRMKELASGEILDCFCYTGGFSLYAARKGNVLGIDSSESALALARRNNDNNGTACQFENAEVFDRLRRFLKEGRKFDTVILDPPSFTQSRKKKLKALKGYKEINISAMKLLNESGILCTSSCSYHIDHQEFLDMLKDAAADAGRNFLVAAQGQQAKDHPVLLNFPESIYLKTVFLRLI